MINAAFKTQTKMLSLTLSFKSLKSQDIRGQSTVKHCQVKSKLDDIARYVLCLFL